MGRHCSGTAAGGLSRTQSIRGRGAEGAVLGRTGGHCPGRCRAELRQQRGGQRSGRCCSPCRGCGSSWRPGRAGGCGEGPSGLRPGGHPYGARRDPRWIQVKDNAADRLSLTFFAHVARVPPAATASRGQRHPALHPATLRGIPDPRRRCAGAVWECWLTHAFRDRRPLLAFALEHAQYDLAGPYGVEA
jgi:hypothetical protein